MVKYLQFLGVAALFTQLLSSCGGGGKANDQDTGPTRKSITKAEEERVITLCSSCHPFVPADMLDKKTWLEGVVPAMAAKMGIFEYKGKTFINEKDDPALPEGIYPSTPTISESDVQLLLDYFNLKAPESMGEQKRSTPIGDFTDLFSPVSPDLEIKEPPFTTFVAVFPQRKEFVIGSSGQKHDIGAYTTDLREVWKMPTPSAPAWVDFSDPKKWLITAMGPVEPNNRKLGSMVELRMPDQGKPELANLVMENLPRPVMIQRLNAGGKDGFLINGFGHLAGQLYWQGAGARPAPEYSLRSKPGAIRSIITDWNQDGKQDVLSLFAQNLEGIFLFLQNNDGTFTEKKLLEFLPVYGSSWFEYVDINGDGKKDIVYTCGDNADFSVALKNYHGVYVYLNKGNDQFEQAWFYPIHGCYRVSVRDFDLDGDLDMVTVGYFADFNNQHEESLLYFANDGKLSFTPYKVHGFDRGRWLTLDAGDVDGDGDQDLVLGNFSMGPQSNMTEQLSRQFASSQPFMVLKNKKR
ncbi:MAG: VCBS repeat-containing protein [Bacteroidetes bacterium]|nr:VCBS repeat-containing protein [Bacteroidota bacterium]